MAAISALSVPKPPADGTQPRVVIGVDDSPGGLAALGWAVRLAQSQHVPLVAVRSWALGLPRHGGRRHRRDGRGHVVFAFQGTEPREAAQRLARKALHDIAGDEALRDLDVTVETPEGDPGRVLVQDMARGGDVLVVGTQRRHGLKRAIHGSVSVYCTAHAPCQVVVVAAEDPLGPAIEEEGNDEDY
ncbi:MAG TPA: universal stress protein [Streptosporangiaceae bacterium]|nr:universal stress protein [Streptosporangiaceae bacterium]